MKYSFLLKYLKRNAFVVSLHPVWNYSQPSLSQNQRDQKVYLEITVVGDKRFLKYKK